MFFTRCVAEYLNEQEKAKALKYNMRRGILFKLTVGKKVHVVTMLHQDPSWSSLPNRKPQWVTYPEGGRVFLINNNKRIERAIILLETIELSSAASLIEAMAVRGITASTSPSQLSNNIYNVAGQFSNNPAVRVPNPVIKAP